MPKKKPSKQKIAANRRNAKQGTGPKTQRGKSFSRLNAVTHGVFAQQAILLPGERPTDLTALRRAYRDQYQPSNQTENFLVDRMILCAYRLTRLTALESRLIGTHGQLSKERQESSLALIQAYRRVLLGQKDFQASLDDDDDDDSEGESEGDANGDETTTPHDAVARAYIRDSESGNTITKLARYQVSLERSFYRALHELQRLRGEPGNQSPAQLAPK